jgi:RNA polymerase sigma-70 factor (ECF subfamily)
MGSIRPDSSRTDQIASVEVHASLDINGLIRIFDRYRPQLMRMISRRLDRCLIRRVDPSDIIQETFLRAAAALDRSCCCSDQSIEQWLEEQASYAVNDCHRLHLATRMNAACAEVRNDGHLSASGLENLAESVISPGSRIANAELVSQVRGLILGMSEVDQQILLLRHVEEMSISESASRLQISVDTAKKRHLRAIRRLRDLCKDLGVSNPG